MGRSSNNFSGGIIFSSTDYGNGITYEEGVDISVDFGTGIGIGEGFELSYAPSVQGVALQVAAYQGAAVRGTVAVGLSGIELTGDFGVGAIFGGGANVEAFGGVTGTARYDWWTGERSFSADLLAEGSGSLGYGTVYGSYSWTPVGQNSSEPEYTNGIVRDTHPHIPTAVMDEIIEREYTKAINNPYATPYGYLGDPAIVRALGLLEDRYKAAQEYVNAVDRAMEFVDASNHSGGGGGNGGGSGHSSVGGSRGGIHGSAGNGDGAVATDAGSLSQDAGITTGTFTPPGSWSGGSQSNGTPDPGLPVNPDYVGIQPIILDLDGDGVEVNASAQVSFDWDGDGFRESGNWWVCYRRSISVGEKRASVQSRRDFSCPPPPANAVIGWGSERTGSKGDISSGAGFNRG